MILRCSCGAPLAGSKRRCKACAIALLKNYETDRFELAVQNEPIVLDFTEEQIQKWQEMSARSLPKVPRTVKPWSETEYRRSQNVRLMFGFGITLFVFALALWAVLSA
jgi:hypothetical protein